MTSHEYAKQLRELADKLEAVDEFTLPGHSAILYKDCGIETLRYYGDKERFLAAVRSIGNGRKDTSHERDFTFVAFDGLLRVTVNRDAVCRIVKPAQPAVYDCEPLLSPEEEALMGER